MLVSDFLKKVAKKLIKKDMNKNLKKMEFSTFIMRDRRSFWLTTFLGMNVTGNILTGLEPAENSFRGPN
jgi:hypothetical protein